MRSSWVMAGVVAALCVGAVGGAAQAKVKLTYLYNWYSGQDLEPGFKQIIDGFRAENKDIDLVLQRGGDGAKLMATIVAGTAPDVVNFDRYIVAEWAARGLLRPISDLMPGVNLSRNFLKSAVGEGTYSGKLYALPMDTDIRGLYVNSRLLQEAGLPPAVPKQWTDIEVYGDKLTKRLAGDKYQQMGFLPWAGNWFCVGWSWTFGGDVYSAATKLPTLNDPRNIKAFQWAQSYTQRYGGETQLTKSGFGGYNEFFTAFTKGRLGMMVAHTGLSTLVTQAKTNVEVVSGPMPHPDGGANGTWSGGFAHVVPKGAKHPKEAGRLLAYLARPDVQARFYRTTGGLPTNRAAFKEISDEIPAMNRPLIPQLDDARWRPVFGSIIWDAIEPVMWSVRRQTGEAGALLNDAQRACLVRWKILAKGR